MCLFRAPPLSPARPPLTRTRVHLPGKSPRRPHLTPTGFRGPSQPSSTATASATSGADCPTTSMVRRTSATVFLRVTSAAHGRLKPCSSTHPAIPPPSRLQRTQQQQANAPVSPFFQFGRPALLRSHNTGGASLPPHRWPMSLFLQPQVSSDQTQLLHLQALPGGSKRSFSAFSAQLGHAGCSTATPRQSLRSALRSSTIMAGLYCQPCLSSCLGLRLWTWQTKAK